MRPLSFIIITFNRPADMLELAKNISTLAQASELLEEVIIVNNASTTDYSEVKRFIQQATHIPFRYFDAPENLGVAKGRNFALAKGMAPIIIMLDDDAILQGQDSLANILKAFEHKKESREPAIISFKVLYYDSLLMQKNALPHKHYKEYKNKSWFETYYYAGGAHAIKREVINQLGNYPEDFFYGMEEYDLGYRILDNGYSIYYDDSIVMLHKESALGRKPKAEKIRMMWVNKSKVAYRYLPIKYFYSTSLMWSLQYLRMTGFDIKGYRQGWKEIRAIKKSIQRTPISEKTLDYLRQLKARLWY
jgi:GT2 family glycosyltransferase